MRTIHRVLTHTRTHIVMGLLALGLVLSSWIQVGASGRVTTQVRLVIDALGELGVGLSTLTDPLNKNYTFNLGPGTGANQASNVYHSRRTLAASATENLDLAGTLTNGFGVTLSFSKVKAIVVQADSTNTNNVLVGGGASTITTFFTNANDQVIVRPGGIFMLTAPDSTGLAVSAGSTDLIAVTNSSSGSSVTYDVIILGVD